MEFTGKIIAVLPEKSGVSPRTNTEWKVQEYVIESHDNYPKKMCFSVFGADKMATFNIQLGEELVVSFDVDAHEYNGRWFNSIRAWKVERVADAAAAGAPQMGAMPPFDAAPAAAPAPADNFAGSADNSDLPF